MCIGKSCEIKSLKSRDKLMPFDYISVEDSRTTSKAYNTSDSYSF